MFKSGLFSHNTSCRFFEAPLHSTITGRSLDTVKAVNFYCPLSLYAIEGHPVSFSYDSLGQDPIQPSSDSLICDLSQSRRKTPAPLARQTLDEQVQWSGQTALKFPISEQVTATVATSLLSTVIVRWP